MGWFSRVFGNSESAAAADHAEVEALSEELFVAIPKGDTRRVQAILVHPRVTATGAVDQPLSTGITPLCLALLP